MNGPSSLYLSQLQQALAASDPMTNPVSTMVAPVGGGYPNLADAGSPPPPPPAPTRPASASSGPPTPSSNTPPPASFFGIFGGNGNGGVGLPNAPGPVAGGPGISPMASGANNAPPPPAPDGGSSSLNEDPRKNMSTAAPQMSQGPQPMGMGVEPRPAPPPERVPFDVQTARVGGGGVTPAHEVPLRGAKQNAYLERSFEHPISAADRIEQRSQLQAQHESAAYDQMAQQALDQQDAFNRMAARREQEMVQLRQNYSDTIQQLGSMHIDNDRLWGNSSTPEKIGTVALAFFSGAFSVGTENKIVRTLEKRNEDDVKVQMLDYKRGLDIAGAQQNAFSMAMQQYGSEDAAYHAAIGAGQQYIAATVGGLAAQWKGTEAANHADDLRAQFQMAADQSKANGWKYVQPQAVAPQYVISVDGKQLPAPVSGAEANRISLEYGAKPGQETDKEITKTGLDIAKEREKHKAEANAYGAVGKTGAEKLALEAKQAEMQRDTALAFTATAKEKLPALVKGGVIGSAYAHNAPAWAPGGVEARKNDLAREDYNRKVGLMFANFYKVATDSPEPKRLEMVKEMIEPYVLGKNENEESARNKITALEGQVQGWSPARGVAPAAPAKVPSSFQADK